MTDSENVPHDDGGAPAPSGAPLALLLEVQRHDTVMDQLRHRRATMPERQALTGIDTRLSALATRLKELGVARDEHGSRQANIEQQIEASKERRATLEKRLYGGQVAAARELQAMSEEVKHLGRHISELEDREIEVMEVLEPLDAELEAGEQVRTSLEAEAAALRTAISDAEVELDVEIDTEAGTRGQVAAGVRADLLERYEKLRARLGGTGAAPLVGGSCGGCHLALPAMEIDRLRRAPADAVITCEQCGRILVR